MLFIVRHSERFDETDKEGFKVHLENESSKSNRHIKFVDGDSPITPNGEQIAVSAGKTLYLLIGHHLTKKPKKKVVIRIFSSKLLRCVQTAYHIAKVLHIPTVYLSKGLALTASCVERSERNDEPFHFISVSELQSTYCRDITLEDCDDCNHVYHIPSHHWLQAIGRITQLSKNDDEENDALLVVNIVVAHRETIRNFGITRRQRRRRLPYCCIAPMKVTTLKSNPLEGFVEMKQEQFQIKALFQPEGELLQSFLPLVEDDEV